MATLAERIVEVVRVLQGSDGEGVLPIEVKDFMGSRICEQTMRGFMVKLAQRGDLERIGGGASRRGYRALIRAERERIYHANANVLLRSCLSDRAQVVIADLPRRIDLSFVAEMVRVLKWRGSAYVITPIQAFDEVGAALVKAGLADVRRIEIDMSGATAYMVAARKIGAVREVSKPVETWRVGPVEFWARHSDQKPMRLMRRVIEESSAAGDLVIATHVGSGTEALSAAQLGRSWIAGDRDADKVQAALARMGKVSRAVDGDYLRWVMGRAG